jgi:MFS family permease
MQAVLASEPTRVAPLGNLRAVMARREFRRLLAVRLTSQIGDGWLQAGLAGSVFFNPERAAGPVAIATAFAVLLLPYSVLGPFVGVFLDRWSRRHVLVVANTVRAVLVLPTAWMVWSGEEGPFFIAVTLAIVALNRFFLAGLSASQPHVTDERRLVTANSLATTAGSVCYSGGLAGAAAIFRLIGTNVHPYAAVALAAVVAYGASALLTMVSFRVDQLGPDDAARAQDSLWSAITDTTHGLRAGLGHLAERPTAAAAVVVQTVNRGLYGLLAISTLLLYRNYYHVHDAAGSVAGLLPVAVAAAAGSVLAAVITPPITRRIGARLWVVLMVAGLAVLVPALAMPTRAPLTVLAAGAVSVAGQGLKIVTDTSLQIACHDDYRGRVFSISDTAINLAFVVGLFLGAVMLPADGRLPIAILGVGAAYAALAAWYAVASAGARPQTVPAPAPVEEETSTP